MRSPCGREEILDHTHHSFITESGVEHRALHRNVAIESFCLRPTQGSAPLVYFRLTPSQISSMYQEVHLGNFARRSSKLASNVQIL